MRPGFAGVANIAAASGMLECVKLVRFITNRDKAAELYRKLRRFAFSGCVERFLAIT